MRTLVFAALVLGNTVLALPDLAVRADQIVNSTTCNGQQYGIP